MLIVALHLVLLTVMVELVWVLGTTNYSTRKLIVGLMVMILYHLGVGIIKLVLLVVLHLVVILVMIEVVCFLGSHTSPIIK